MSVEYVIIGASLVWAVYFLGKRLVRMWVGTHTKDTGCGCASSACNEPASVDTKDT